MYRITVLFLFLFSVSAQSQKTEVKIEKLEAVEDHKQGTLLFAKQVDNGDIYIVSKVIGLSKLGYYISRYSKDVRFLEEVFIENHKSEIIGLVINDDSIDLIQFGYNFDTKNYDLSVFSSNRKEFNFSKEIIYSIERKEINKYDDFGFNEVHDFYKYGFQPFKKYGFFQEGRDGKNNVFAICLKDNNYIVLKLDDSLKLTETYSIYGDKKNTSTLEDLAIDENGDVYFLERKFNNDSGKLKNGDKIDFYFVLHKFSPNRSQKVLEIALQKNIVNIKILNNENYFSLGGTHFEEDYSVFSSTFVGGMFRADIDVKKMKLESVDYLPFSTDFLNVKHGGNHNKGLYLPRLKNVFLKENGNIIFATEEAYVIGSGQHSYSGIDDIFVTEIAPDGTVVWDKLVTKPQGTDIGVMNYKYFSYMSNLMEEKCVFVFNSHKDVERISASEHVFKSSSFANSWAYLLEIDNAGNTTHKTLSTNFEDVFVLNVKRGMFINENTFLVHGKLNGEKNVFKIKI